MRWIRLLSLLNWFCFAFWSAIFYWFWRAEWTWPHGVWGVLSLGSMIALSLWLHVLCAGRIWRDRCRPNRSWVALLGWLLIAMAPLAWFGGHWLDASLAFKQRLSRPRTTVNRVAVTWLSSFFDGVSRIRYRRAPGKHVVLFHGSDYPDANRLTGDMDQHIVAMSERLGGRPPGPIGWVRGSLGTATAVAIGPWAITSDGQDRHQLTNLDRHEVAHSVISELCDRHPDPPRLLVEGWAQSQSEDRSRMILELARTYRNRKHFYLDELIEEPWYSASCWPVYQYGGPLVIFLMERFSGEKFLQLYGEVRRESFRVDVGRVLGVPWKQLEADFWTWLESEAKRIDADQDSAGGQGFDLEFSGQVSEQDWNDLVARYAEVDWSQRPFQSDVAITVDAEVDDPEFGGVFERKLDAVFEGGQYWLRYWTSANRCQYVMMSEQGWASLTRDPDGVVTGTSGGNENKADVRADAHHLIDLVRGPWESDPGYILPLSREPLEYVKRFRCTSLTRASADDDHWQVKYRKWIVDHQSTDETIEERGTVWLADSDQLAVTRHVVDQLPSGFHYESETKYEQIGGIVLPTDRRKSRRRTEAEETITSRVRSQPLCDAEVDAVKQSVQQAADSVDTSRSKSWFEYVWLLPCSQPIVGLLCVWLGTRRTVKET